MVTGDMTRDALPTSHFFITVARGRSSRTFMARRGVGLVLAAVVPAVLIWVIGSSLYLGFHDDLVASLMLRQRDMQYGYEDQIASLRSQIDRDATNRAVGQRSVDAKLEELSTREAQLRNRSGVLARLQDQAARLGGGIVAATLESNASSNQPEQSSFALPGARTAPSTADAFRAGLPKPRPEAAIMAPSSDDPGEDVERSSSAKAVSERLSSLSVGLDAISTGQETTVAALDTSVRKTVGRFRSALDAVGVSEGRLAAHQVAGGSGGPFVPLIANDDASSFSRAVVSVQLTLSQATLLRETITHVPFDKPLAGDPEITSPFGARVDPFLGRPAMHTGIDLRDETGTTVRATAVGKVTSAGLVSGYGLMIEVDHGAGLATRYAHLSDIDVTVGDAVKTGQVIGRVGATGRATGPHLHYETRLDGEPVDPIRFLAAGRRFLGDKQAL